eukprot:3267690-Karenia_brevis.AAC.1
MPWRLAKKLVAMSYDIEWGPQGVDKNVGIDVVRYRHIEGSGKTNIANDVVTITHRYRYVAEA